MRFLLPLMILGMSACGKENDLDGSCPDGNLLEVENEGCACGDLVFETFEEDVGCSCTDGELLCTDDQEENAA